MNFFSKSDENQRQQTLRGLKILDTPDEAAFDRVTKMAARLLAMPIALITFLDDERQWFKSAHGVEIRETHRADSFCTHTVEGNVVLAVPDATKDARFANLVIVKNAPYIRFYAGAPIYAPNGIKIGSLCVLDVEARIWSKAQDELLLDLASIVSDEIELHDSTRRAREQEAKLRQETAHLENLRKAQFAIATAPQDLESVRECIANQMHNLIACDGATLSDIENDFAVCRTSNTGAEQFDSLISLKNSLTGDAVTANRVLVCNNLAQSPHPAQEIHTTNNLCSLLIVPLEHEQKLLWTLTLWSKEPDAFDEHAIQTADLMRGLIGTAMGRAVEATSKRTALAALQESTKRFESAFSLSPIGMALISPQGRWLQTNRVLCEILGYSESELTDYTFQEITHEEDIDISLEKARALLNGEITRYEIEKRYRHKKGHLVWVKLTVSLVNDQNEAPLYLIAQVQDITQRRANDEQLRLLQSAVTHLNDTIIITQAEPVDEPGPRIVYANEAFTRLTGYSVAEAMGQTPRFLQGPKTQPDRRAAIRKALEEWKPIVVELINYHKNGHEFWSELSIVPVADETGHFTQWVSVQRDVTSRKKSEELLRLSEERYRLLAENSRDLIGLLNTSGEVVYASPSHYEVLGFESHELIGHNVFDIIAPECAPLVLEAVGQLLQQNEYSNSTISDEIAQREETQRTIEVTLCRKDGSWLIFEANLSLIEIEELQTHDDLVDENPIPRQMRLLLSARDISKRKQAEMNLEAARDEAEAANRAKSDFLSRMSHELRTPMNAILGFAQLLEMDELDKGQEECVEHILGAGNHLLELINEVLDLARIEAGKMTLSPEVIPISQILLQSLQMVSTLANEHDVVLPENIDFEYSIVADSQRLRQVMLNLLSNAVKYNRRGGGVRCSAEKVPHVNGEMLQISISDDGPGLSPAQIERLFTPFERLEADNSMIQGTGLGLSLSRYLMEAMNGTLDVHSEPEMGATFRLQIPLAGNLIFEK